MLAHSALRHDQTRSAATLASHPTAKGRLARASSARRPKPVAGHPPRAPIRPSGRTQSAPIGAVRLDEKLRRMAAQGVRGHHPSSCIHNRPNPNKPPLPTETLSPAVGTTGRACRGQMQLHLEKRYLRLLHALRRLSVSYVHPAFRLVSPCSYLLVQAINQAHEGQARGVVYPPDWRLPSKGLGNRSLIDVAGIGPRIGPRHVSVNENSSCMLPR